MADQVNLSGSDGGGGGFGSGMAIGLIIVVVIVILLLMFGFNRGGTPAANDTGGGVDIPSEVDVNVDGPGTGAPAE